MKKLALRLLCNEVTGKLISVLFSYNIPNCRYGFRRFKTPKKNCNNTVRAMIFWGFYEGAEMRLIPKYLPSQIPVIELGASLGITSSRMIGFINNNVQYTCIEANPFLTDYIKYNIKRHNTGKNNFKVENVAIAYTSNEFVELLISENNTSGRVSYEPGATSTSVKVKTATLAQFSKLPYTLICDIEGMEIELFKNDQAALANCRHLFIELHKCWYIDKYLEIGELVSIVKNELGFDLIEKDGNVFYFRKR